MLDGVGDVLPFQVRCPIYPLLVPRAACWACCAPMHHVLYPLRTVHNLRAPSATRLPAGYYRNHLYHVLLTSCWYHYHCCPVTYK